MLVDRQTYRHSDSNIAAPIPGKMFAIIRLMPGSGPLWVDGFAGEIICVNFGPHYGFWEL